MVIFRERDEAPEFRNFHYPSSSPFTNGNDLRRKKGREELDEDDVMLMMMRSPKFPKSNKDNFMREPSELTMRSTKNHSIPQPSIVFFLSGENYFGWN